MDTYHDKQVIKGLRQMIRSAEATIYRPHAKF